MELCMEKGGGTLVLIPLGKNKTLNSRTAIYVLQTISLYLKSFYVLLMLFVPLVLRNYEVFPTCECDT